MTITDKDREAAAAIINEWWTGKPTPTLEQRIAAAIAQAREEATRVEREACLSDIQCADSACNYGTTAHAALRDAERRIRARGEV